MTTAHRPTFDPARGKEALRGPAYHQRLLPAHTHLKYRQNGQGGDADDERQRDLAAELLAAESLHYSTKKFVKSNATSSNAEKEHSQAEASHLGAKRSSANDTSIEGSDVSDNAGREREGGDWAAKRRRILAETRHIDADDDSSSGEHDEETGDTSDEEDSDDDEDAELQRELERVRRERDERKRREEAERAKEEQEARERDIALGNPLLNKQDFTMKRRWDDDVVFKNQARGTEDKGKKEFVNDMLRSDFHRRFMSKYVR